MPDITIPGMFLTGDHASRPAANAVGGGSLYACSTHSLIYQSDGSSWSTWATLASGSFDEDLLPWTVSVDPYLAKSNTNWSTITSDTALHGYIMQSSGAQNAE